MANKAVSKVVTQVALVFGLVLAANAIKPFSPGNLTSHTMASARSFSFLLPDGAVKRIEQANYLAQTFSRGLFEQSDNNSMWTREGLLKSGFLASNASAESLDDAEIKDIKPGDTAKKPSPAKRATRRVRQDSRNHHDEASASNSGSTEVGRRIQRLPFAHAIDSVAMIQPVQLPIFRPMPAKADLTPASAMFSLPLLPAKLNSCKTIEVKEVKLIALIQQSQRSSKLKVDMLATQPAKISLQCREEEKAVTEEAESVLETTTTTGPEEELFFDQRATGPFFSAPVPERVKLP